MHPRDKLTALLWGGVPEPRARASLRQALFTLRRALGDAAELLVQEGENVGLDTRNLETLVEGLGDQRRLGWILSYSALEVWRQGEAERAVRLAERVLAIGRALDDLGLRVMAGIRLGQASHSLGRYAQAVEALRATVHALQGDLSRETYGLSAPPGVIARIWLAWCLAERGEFAEGTTPRRGSRSPSR